jgi:endoglucanase
MVRGRSFLVVWLIAAVAASCGDGGSGNGGSGGASGTGATPGASAASGTGGATSGTGGTAGSGAAGGTGATSGTGGTSGPTIDHPSTDTEWSAGLPVGPNGPIPFIVVDQFGYRTSAAKVAVIRDPQQGYDAGETFTPGNEYAVVDVVTDDTVFSGPPRSWNEAATDAVSGDKVWWFDFSSVTTPGNYYVLDVARGRRSVHFRIDDAVYRSILKHAVRSFYYQRAGQEKNAAHAGAEWADDASHLGPGQDGETRAFMDKDNPATARDLRGGWYDAGDLNKYTAWTAHYVINLLRAFEQNPTAFGDDYTIPESGNGVPDVLDEAKWGLDWLVRMQQSDGSVLSVQGLTSGSPPSSATGPSYYGGPTTNASLATASAFAYASKLYGAHPEPDLQAFASDLAARAVQAYGWANANPNVAFYNNDGDAGTSGLGAGQQEVDEAGRLRSKLEAAIYLFEQTGDTNYRDFVDANYGVLVPEWGPQQWHAAEQELLLYYSQLPGATAAIAAAARERFRTQIEKDDLYGAVLTARDPYRAHINDYVWGSNTSKGLVGRLLQLVEAYGIDATLAPNTTAAAEEYAHYIHGENPLGLVYLTNMRRAGAEHSAKTLFHSWFSDGSPRWDEVTPTSSGPAPGLLVGGPNPSYGVDGCCTDGSSCYGAAEFVLCSADYEPPGNQPAMKSYLQFNAGWPANSWAVTENSNGYRLPSLSKIDVAEVLQTVRTRVLSFLERRGVIESRRESTLIDDGSAEQEPALAALASAAVGGAAPAGPERRERPALALRNASGMRIASALSVAEGFSPTLSARCCRAASEAARHPVRWCARGCSQTSLAGGATASR